ncbi:MAG TPA: porin family protein, partial [Acetobacteraceae bacterium]|nr:porin family protein [Acetobacteraceae bacterium]
MRNLKLIVSAAAIVSTLVGITAATAADLPARTYTKAPVYVEPAFNWSGFYVGGN